MNTTKMFDKGFLERTESNCKLEFTKRGVALLEKVLVERCSHCNGVGLNEDSALKKVVRYLGSNEILLYGADMHYFHTRQRKKSDSSD